MKINIDVDAILRSRGMGSDAKTQRFIANEVANLSDDYVPFQSGTLKNTRIIANDGSSITYRGPYAHYHWVGEIYGPNIPLGDEGFFSRAPKKPTGAPDGVRRRPDAGAEVDGADDGKPKSRSDETNCRICGRKSKMTNIEAVRKWLRTYESLSSGRLGVDFLPEKAQTYSVDSVPGPEIVKRYLDGSAVKQFDFVLASREFFGDSIGQNADNLQWYEEFSAWVAQQNRRPKHLPELMPGRRAQKVEVTTSGYPFQMTSEGKARYQIQLKMTYFEKGAR